MRRRRVRRRFFCTNFFVEKDPKRTQKRPKFKSVEKKSNFFWSNFFWTVFLRKKFFDFRRLRASSVRASLGRPVGAWFFSTNFFVKKDPKRTQNRPRIQNSFLYPRLRSTQTAAHSCAPLPLQRHARQGQVRRGAPAHLRAAGHDLCRLPSTRPTARPIPPSPCHALRPASAWATLGPPPRALRDPAPFTLRDTAPLTRPASLSALRPPPCLALHHTPLARPASIDRGRPASGPSLRRRTPWSTSGPAPRPCCCAARTTTRRCCGTMRRSRPATARRAPRHRRWSSPSSR